MGNWYYWLAMRSGIGEKEEEMIEGDYTTWTLKWVNDVPDGLSSHYIGFYIDEKNEVINLRWRDSTSYNDAFGIYNLSDFSEVFRSPSAAFYTPYWPRSNEKENIQFGFAHLIDGGFSRSLQSYTFLLRADYHTIEVWRGGSNVLWSHNTQIDVAGCTIESGGISLTGKWILVREDNTNKLILYEGS